MQVDNELEQLRQEAIKDGLSFGVTRLREQYRMKPKEGVKPVRWVKNQYGRGKNPHYFVADCQPLKERAAKAQTDAQRLGRLIAGLKARLRSSVNKESVRVRQWLTSNACSVVYLDTETTGLANNDQIIELAIMDSLGATLFNHRFKPTVAITPNAMAVHNITEADLVNCPSWPEYQEQISQILAGKVVVIFNESFDIRLLQQTAAAFGCPVDWIAALSTQCAMMTAVRAFGATNRHGTISLANAASEVGLSWHGQAHNALVDCDMTRRLILAISQHCEPVLSALDDAEVKRVSSLLTSTK